MNYGSPKNPNKQVLKETALKKGVSKWFSSKKQKFDFSILALAIKKDVTNYVIDKKTLTNKNEGVLRSHKDKFFKVVNKKKLSDLKTSILLKYCSQDVDISLGNENSIFENVAPHLDQIDDFSATSSYRKTFIQRKIPVIAKKDYNTNITKAFPFENTCFIPLFDNYYQTDVISKSSITMGKSSLSFKNQS